MRRVLLFIALFWGLSATAAVADDAVQVRLLASNLRPYVGESVVITMEIVRPERLPQSLSPVWPKMTDLLVEENLPSVARRLTGIGEARIVESLRRLVRPTRPGEIILQQAAVAIGGSRSDAGPLRLQVLPLPARNIPDNFGGAVGTVKVQLEDTGSGRRQIMLRLSGRAGLDRLPSPLLADPADRLLLLEDQNQGRWPERVRELRYLLLPAEGSPKRLQVNLSWFDPKTGTYHRYQDTDQGEGFRLWRWLLPVLLASGLCWLYCRYQRYRALARLLAQKQRICPQKTLLAQLRRYGAAETLLQELQHHWRYQEFHFSPGARDVSLNKALLPTKLVWKLSSRIDKSGLYRP